MGLSISSIHIYPIKSLKGISVNSSLVYQVGLERDRRWMLSDLNGNFISQRMYPILSQISTCFTESGIKCAFQNDGQETSMVIPFNSNQKEETKVKVWDSEFGAHTVGTEYDNWFSGIIGQRVRLIYMNNPGLRKKKLVQKPYSTIVSFADGYPVLILNEASLNDLNSRLEKPISKDRFRGNIWLTDLPPYKEEELDEFSIGEVRFKMIKPCARCIMINIDPENGISSYEPLKTLSSYRKENNKVYFGMNAICLNSGKIKCGEKLIL